MCGIAGIFLTDQNLSSSLGNLLTKMLGPLGDRGPDSAGVAIYKEADENTTKITRHFKPFFFNKTRSIQYFCGG